MRYYFSIGATENGNISYGIGRYVRMVFPPGTFNPLVDLTRLQKAISDQADFFMRKDPSDICVVKLHGPEVHILNGDIIDDILNNLADADNNQIVTNENTFGEPQRS